MLTPDPSLKFSTEINIPRIGIKGRPRTERYEEYSFNFYGIIPVCKNTGILEHGQFIFNRNDNGRLVKIMRLPDSYGILPHHYYQENSESESDDALPSNAAMNKYQVVIDEGGYNRVGNGFDFALLLTICKLRWWPGLWMGDDYNNCEFVDELITKYGLHEQMRDENLDFDTCCTLLKPNMKRSFHLLLNPAPKTKIQIKCQ